jgi:HK97 family phage prohead protease
MNTNNEWQIRGLACPYNRVIRGGTRPGAQLFRPGAFAKSLREEAVIDLCLDHTGGRNGESICDSTRGLFLEERGDGLYFRAWPDGCTFAQRGLLAVIAGKVRGCSIACHIEDSQIVGHVEVVHRAALVEISLTDKPACALTWCKTISPEQQLREREGKRKLYSERSDYGNVRIVGHSPIVV